MVESQARDTLELVECILCQGGISPELRNYRCSVVGKRADCTSRAAPSKSSQHEVCSNCVQERGEWTALPDAGRKLEAWLKTPPAGDETFAVVVQRAY